MPRRSRTLATGLGVFAFGVVLGGIFTPFSDYALAQAGHAAAVSQGLPWNAIAFLGIGGLNLLTLVVTIRRGDAAKVDDLEAKVGQVEADLRAEIVTASATQDAKVGALWDALATVNENLIVGTTAIVSVVNVDRMSRFSRDVECARRHDEDTPPQPDLIEVPNFREVRRRKTGGG